MLAHLLKHVNVWKKMRNRFHSFIAYLHSSKKTSLLIIIVFIAFIAITATISMLLNKIASLYVPSLGAIKTLGVKAY
jgi:hypothetical protein